MTITEALAEIKTIGNRVVKKKEAVTRYFSRDSRLRDPLEAEGGSKEFVRCERQGIADLEERLLALRQAIQRANLNTNLTLLGVTRSVAGWLNWRREVSNSRKGFLAQLAQMLNTVRAQAARQQQAVTTSDPGPTGDIVVAVNEQELAAEIESLENLLGALDGKLSLLNATLTVEV